MSSSTTETSGVEKLQDQLNAFKKQSVSLSGKTGYFVSKGALDHFSAELEKEMLQSEHPNSLIEMAEELEKVRRDSATLGTLYSEAKNRISSLEKSLVDMKKLKDKAVQDAKDSKAMSDSSRATLLEQLSNAQKAKIEIQKEFEMARKGFDPEPALHAEKALAESKREISELQKSLEDLNRDNKNANAEIAKYTVQINAAQQEIAKCKEEINKASEARKLNSCNPIEQVKVPPVELNSRVARLVLGKQGVLWLQKAEQVVYDDYREKAYNLMLACKKGNTPNVKSIGNLLEIVYKWLKVQAQYVRKKVASWLTMIEKDLRQGTLRRVSYYRDELKKLQVQILDESKANGKADGSKGHRDFNEHPLAWWEHVYYGVIVLKNRSVRKTSSFFGKMIFEAQRAKSWLLNLFGHGKGKYRAYGKPSDETEEIFDHDTYADKLKAHDDATEKDKIKLTEMPPEPLKEEFQESTVGMAEKPKKPLQRPLRKAFGGGGSPAAAKLEELFGKPKNK